MTILVLELRKPSEITLQGFWSLHANFFAYALSFFGLERCGYHTIITGNTFKRLI
nr:DUF1211 domain-containing protein [Pediococcus acidilactici]